MELQGRVGGDVFAIGRRMSNIYLMEFEVMTLRVVAWMDNGRRTELTHQALVERLEGVDIITTARE